MNIFHRGSRAVQSPALPLCKRLLASVVLLLFAYLSAGAQQFAFKHYGQDEGLRNLDVFRLLQDKAGFLWSATENGLFRYDGSAFRRFGAADGIEESMVVAVDQDASGRIWITTNDHLYFFSGNRFEVVPSDVPLQLGVGQRLTSIDPQHILLLSRTTLMLAQQSGPQHHWALTPYFTAQQTAEHPELSQIHSVFADRDGTLWFGCDQTLCRVKDNRIDVLGTLQGLPPTAAWLAFYRDSHGVLWARSPHYVSVLLPGSNRFVSRDITPDAQSLFIGAGILTLAEDRDGNILTQSTTGIARWNGSRWQIFDRSNGLDFSDISTILSDQQGSVWFSTRGHGLERWLGYGKIENWTTAQGLRNDIVWSFFRDNRNRLWIGDQLQINQLDEQTKTIHPVLNFHSDFFQQTDGIAQSPDGSIWIASLSGRFMHSNRLASQFTELHRLPNIVRLFTDSSHRLWFCTREGLYVIRHPENQPVVEKIDSPLIAIDSFADAAEDSNGNIWFVSDHHLYRLADPDSKAPWTEIPLDPKLTRGEMRAIAIAPDGTLWIGGGLPTLLHLKVQNNTAQVLATLSTSTIVSTDIQFVRFDHQGWLWVGTDLGVNVFDGRHWKLLTQRDGLISNDTNEGAFFADTDGSVWIGVNGGATHLLHPRKLFTDDNLQVMLSSATLGDRVLNLSGSKNTWRWRNSPLDIKFTSLNYNREDSLRFRYRLIGLEPAWNQTTQHSLHYPAMPPGDYRFEVEALDPNQRNASDLVSLAFTIRPPWWRTRIFYLFLALLGLTLSVLLWRWRERLLIRRQKHLEQLITQRTSELEAEKIELVAAREALQHQASHDALTGLWNRSAILEVLEHEMNRAQREHTNLAVVLADLDHFKWINDTHGHLAGDAILRDAAHRMLENIRPYDFIGRYGGEEFLIVLPGLSAEEPFSRLTQLHQAMSGKPFVYNEQSFHITSSFGVSSINRSMMTVEDMVRCADEALYKAKASGRNCIIHYDKCRPHPMVEIP